MTRKQKYFTEKQKEEGQNAVRKLWVSKNKDKVYLNHKKWRDQPENHKKLMGFVAAWQKTPQDKYCNKINSLTWRKNNPERVRKNQRIWRLNNPDKVRAIKKKYRDRKKNGLV